MEKFFKLLYYYILAAFVLGVLYLSIMLFAAPRQDALERGFIPCTKKLVIDMSACEKGRISCPLKHLVQDMKCNVTVVLDGFGGWIKGEQPTPWTNYLFEPKALAEIDEELPYPGNVVKDMNDIEKQRRFIEKKQAELEEAKNRKLELNQNIITGNPEAEEIPSADKKNADSDQKIEEVESGDIADEVFEDENWDTNESITEKQPSKEDTKNDK